MKIYLNDHHTSEYLQMVLCMYNTDHMYYSPEENSAYIYVGFSLCVTYIIEADFSQNKINFIKEHKVLPIKPICLHLIYWQMLCFARHSLVMVYVESYAL